MPCNPITSPACGQRRQATATSQAMASPSHRQQQSRAGGERTSRALGARARAWAASRRQVGKPSASGHVFCLAAAAARRALCGRPDVLARGTPPAGTGRAGARAANLSSLGAPLARAARSGQLTAWLAVGPAPRDATGRFSAEVACQHGPWLAPAFAAGFKRG